ncbi:MAG: lipopolysaccharide biosynthesis protein [Nostocaceae cyanobacterium]|nr:lipopolysaccharide biosynthesis protein [Nostocaceae cyanobacterium]
MKQLHLINKLKQSLSSQYIRNVGWLGAAELVNRIFRLGVTVTLARMFSPQDYGLMAVVYTTVEFSRIFTFKGGIGSKIIQADEQDVKTICDTAYWLNWIICILVFIIQCIAAFPIAKFYGNNQLILPLCTVAFIYLLLPIFMVQSAMIERENRLKIKALCNATQSIISHILTVILAILGMGVWAIVWPMVLSTPVWIVISYMKHPWRPPNLFKLDKWQEIISFGSHMLGVELLGMLRWNLDYLIVGKFLGIEALGVYYFAFNAGLGISLNVLNTFTSALFPYLCEALNNIKQLEERFFSSLKKTYTFIIPIIILQSSLAPFYVPIVFGQKWVTAIPLVVLLCLYALASPLSSATYILLNAVGKTQINLYWNLIYTFLFGIVLLATVHWGIFWVVISVLICQAITPIFNIWAIKYVFTKYQTVLVK